jgi:hypothetical protein
MWRSRCVNRHLSQKQRLFVLLLWLLGKLLLQLSQCCIKLLAVVLQCSALQQRTEQQSISH